MVLAICKRDSTSFYCKDMTAEIAGIAAAITMILALGTLFCFLSLYNVIQTPYLACCLNPFFLYFSTAFTLFASYFTIGYLIVLFFSESEKNIPHLVILRTNTASISSLNKQTTETLISGFFPSEMNEDLMNKNLEVPFYRSILVDGDYITLSPVNTELPSYLKAYPLLYYDSNKEELKYFTNESTRKNYLEGICKTRQLINYQEKFQHAKEILSQFEVKEHETLYTIFEEEKDVIQIFFRDETNYYVKRTQLSNLKDITDGATRVYQ